MIQFAADEDLDNHIVRGLRHRLPEVDVVRVQEVDLSGAPDESVLAWAADMDRVSTMTAAAHSRIARGEALPGLIIVPQSLAIGAAIEDLVLVATCSVSDDWANHVRFIPLA